MDAVKHKEQISRGEYTHTHTPNKRKIS